MTRAHLARAALALALAAPAAGADTVADVAAAHNLPAWWGTDVLVADVTVRWGDRVGVQGTMAFETNGPRARFDFASGETVVYDGETCWISPAGADLPRARFHVLTWSWFTAAPFKLEGDGVVLTPYERERPADDDAPFLFARQTFRPGEGDTPDDWYDIWIDPATHRLAAMGYVVTYGTPLAEAEQEPHAIVYDAYEAVNGIPIATRWSFWDYTDGEAIGATKLGTGTLENVRFEEAGDRFDKPEGAAEVMLPGS